MILTISGLHGTGKSTIGKLIAEDLGIQYYSTGQAFRDLANEMNMSLKEFSKFVEKTPKIDKKLDEGSYPNDYNAGYSDCMDDLKSELNTQSNENKKED